MRLILNLETNQHQTGGFLFYHCFLAISTLLLAQVHTSESLRTGAPALACLNLRPFHGLHRAKPASSSQFFITQSSYSYAPGQNVTVNVTTHSTERYFRGFIIQAYDPTTGATIGHFLPSDDSRPIDSCSAATHRNNLNKHHVSLTWLPPSFSVGSLLGQDTGPSAANQWLGANLAPGIRFNVNNQKRQLAPSVEPAPPAVAPASAPAPASGGSATPVALQPSLPAANRPVANSNGLHQVKFKGTIVVTYEEFYSGFESTDQSFDKFDFAPKPTK